MSEFNPSARTKANPLGRVVRDPNDRVGETLDRLRRMETKITLIMEKLDLNTQAQKAEWSGGKVVVPSLDIKLRDILDVVPKTWGVESEIHVAHKGEQVISFFLPEED